jgi:hypothetical protein
MSTAYIIICAFAGLVAFFLQKALSSYRARKVLDVFLGSSASHNKSMIERRSSSQTAWLPATAATAKSTPIGFRPSGANLSCQHRI